MKFSRTIFAFLLIAFALPGCGVKKYQSKSQPVVHALWDTLLQKYVNEQGNVNYKGFIQDSTQLNNYLTLLKNNHPNDNFWSEKEQLAYWINAYNAFTVQLIIRNYPVKSIKDIKNGIPFVNTVWDIQFIKIEGATYDLNNIEHGIIRKQFNEPRIHVGLNCASVSCPRLRNEAYTAARLDEQLSDQMKYFLRNPIKNQVTTDNPKLSKIFSWFGGDFKINGMDKIEYINQYTPVKIGKDAKIEYLDYDWNLNE